MREKALYRTVRDIQDVRTRRDGRDDANMPLTERAGHNNKMNLHGRMPSAEAQKVEH